MRTIAAEYRVAEELTSLPDSASMPIAWREVEGSELRPRLPSRRLVWLTQVVRITVRAIGLLSASAWPE